MYENVKKILDKSRATGEDVLVSADMVMAEEGRTDGLKTAKEVVDKYYDTITKCRREKDENTIKALCDALEKGNMAEVTKIKAEVKAR